MRNEALKRGHRKAELFGEKEEQPDRAKVLRKENRADRVCIESDRGPRKAELFGEEEAQPDLASRAQDRQAVKACADVMTAEEMNREFRLAADPKAQIRILAERNLITQHEVVEILKSTGIEVKTKAKRNDSIWTHEKMSLLMRMYAEGYTIKEIAVVLGVSFGKVRAKIDADGLRRYV